MESYRRAHIDMFETYKGELLYSFKGLEILAPKKD